jgi:hypothetical protein
MEAFPTMSEINTRARLKDTFPQIVNELSPNLGDGRAGQAAAVVG